MAQRDVTVHLKNTDSKSGWVDRRINMPSAFSASLICALNAYFTSNGTRNNTLLIETQLLKPAVHYSSI